MTPILVMDEPTTGLDNVTESELLETLKDLTRGKTTIMIAHRLSTIEIADRILVLDGGKVVQEGRHSDLIQETRAVPDSVRSPIRRETTCVALPDSGRRLLEGANELVPPFGPGTFPSS